MTLYLNAEPPAVEHGIHNACVCNIQAFGQGMRTQARSAQGFQKQSQDRAAGAMLGYPGRVFVVLLLAVLVWAQAAPKEAMCGLDMT